MVKVIPAGDRVLHELAPADFNDFYELMAISFPADEIRPPAEQRALFELPNYHVGVVTEPAYGIAAFIAVRDFELGCYIEHFAVVPEWRGRGCGSRILRELIGLSPKPLFLEVEPPDTREAVKRIEFYKRSGFCLNDFPYVQPPISEGRRPLTLKIMTFGRKIDAEEFRAIKALLYKSVYNVSLN